MNANKPTLYLIRGVSGSGKSTVAEVLRERENTVHLEADSLFTGSDGVYRFDPARLPSVHSVCRDECYECLHSGYNIVLSNTSTRKEDVLVYKQIADACGANFVSLIVENYHESGNVHGVPEATLARQEQQLRASIKLR